jgi:hypothetical protein
MTCLRPLVLALALSAAWPAAALAQAPAPPEDDPDLDLNFSQPDFTIVGLPTTLRLPLFKSAFRVTHRFGRPLGSGDFGDLFGDAFGLDSGAQIGLEFRFGLLPGTQVGVHRTSTKTIEFFGQYSALRQEDGWFGVGIVASVEGLDNFQESYSPALGVIVSRELGTHGALYLEPMWVNNSNPLPDELTDEENDTFIVGLGGRLRVRPTVYLVGEVIPRTGYDPGVTYGTFGIEKRAGGHTFQLNFSNGFGTTMGQLARGGTAGDDWYLGFNISRKFF